MLITIRLGNLIIEARLYYVVEEAVELLAIRLATILVILSFFNELYFLS